MLSFSLSKSSDSLYKFPTLLLDPSSSYYLVMGSVNSSRSKSSSSVYFFSSDGLADSANISFSDASSSVRFFLGAGAEDLVPLLLFLGLVTAVTLPFKASFCFAKACSFAVFSSLALHSAM